MHKDLGEKQWIAPAAHKKLKAIATAPLFLKDVRQLSPHAQKYGLQSFHTVVNRFAPKSTAFSYECMAARTMIAIMHFNENSARLQAETREGHKQWHVKAPKARKGALTVRSHKTPVAFGYVDKLHQQVLERCKTHPTFKVALAERPPKVPPSFVSPGPKPSKEELLAAHKKPVTRIPETGCGFRRKFLPYPADHTCRQDNPVPPTKPPPQPANESPVSRKTITPFSPVVVLMHRMSVTPELEIKQAEYRNTQAQHDELWVLCDASSWLNAGQCRTYVTAA
ncbi:unnamed protein product [Ixodes persulcatus]